MSHHEARTRSALAIVLIITFALHLLVIAEPFGRDQGIFAYIGQTLLQGGVPYRDAWDHKPPGIYAVYAAAFALFGENMASVHLLEGIILTVTAFFVYKTGLKLFGAGVGLLGALLYGSSATLLFEWWDRGQAEIYMGLTGALAVYSLLLAFALRASPASLQRWRRERAGAGSASSSRHWGAAALAVSGFFCGLTVYFKPTGLPLLVGLAVVVVIVLWRAGLQEIMRAALVMGVGFALSFVPLLAYFAANGALGDFYQTVIVFNTYHSRIGGNPTLAGNLAGTLDFLASMNILAPLALLGLWLACAAVATHVGGRLRPDPAQQMPESRAGLRPAPTASAAQIILPVWLIASAAGVWTQGKFFSYHWSPVLPPLALLAAWGALAAIGEIRRLPGRAGRSLAILVCVFVLVIYAAALVRDHMPKWTRDASYLLRRTSTQAYLANFGHNIQGRDTYSFVETQETALYLQAHTSPDDTVLVWGFQALVNVLADRRAPTRYIFTYPLTFDRPETDFRVQARRTFLRDMQEQTPLYIVLVTNDVNPLQAVDSFGLLAGFPELELIIRQRYRLETDIGEFHIYRRSDA